ncbi:MAG: hypothetical protein ACYC64_18715 [Armatimonadota bacterium]
MLDYLEKHKVIDGVIPKGHRLSEGLKSLAADVSIVGDVRGKGLMWGLEFVRDKATREPFELDQKLSL